MTSASNDVASAPDTAGGNFPIRDDVTVDLDDLDFSQLLRTPSHIKEETATLVAKSIINIFGASLFGCFLLQVGIILLALWYPTEVTNHIVPALGGSLIEIVKLVGTLFSPLLAFILGYYFSVSSRSGKP